MSLEVSVKKSYIQIKVFKRGKVFINNVIMVLYNRIVNKKYISIYMMKKMN